MLLVLCLLLTWDYCAVDVYSILLNNEIHKRMKENQYKITLSEMWGEPRDQLAVIC